MLHLGPILLLILTMGNSFSASQAVIYLISNDSSPNMGNQILTTTTKHLTFGIFTTLQQCPTRDTKTITVSAYDVSTVCSTMTVTHTPNLDIKNPVLPQMATTTITRQCLMPPISLSTSTLTIPAAFPGMEYQISPPMPAIYSVPSQIRPTITISHFVRLN